MSLQALLPVEAEEPKPPKPYVKEFQEPPLNPKP